MKFLTDKLRTYESIYRDLKNGEQKLDDILLYVDFIKNRYDLPMVLLKDGSVLIMFEISGIDYEKLSGSENESYSDLVRNGFQQLERGFTISNYLDRDINMIYSLKKNDSAPEIIKYVQNKKQSFWNDVSAKSFSNKIYCSLRFWNPEKKEIPWTTLIHEKKLFEFSKKEIEIKVEKLYQGYLTIKSIFSKFGFYLLDKKDVFKTLYKIINHSAPPGYRDDLSLNVQLAHSGYLFRKDSVVISNRNFCKLISIKYPPKESFSLYLKKLYDLNIRIIIKQSFQIMNYQKMEKKIVANQNIARSLSNIDKSSENYVHEADEFMNEVKINREIPVKWNLSIMLSTDDEEALNEKSFEVINILKEIGSTGMIEQFNLKNGYFGLLPGHEKLNARYSTILTKNAGDFFSAYLLYRGDNNPVDYFLDRTNGIFSYNPFTKRENAWHMAITGPTGGGKSFMVNKMLLSSLVEDPFIYVIDLSHSFSEFFEFLNEELKDDTSILTISKDKTNFSFNPFFLEYPDREIPEQQMKFCEGLLKIMIGSNLINEGNRIILTDTLKQFFIQYRSILRNLRGRPPHPPLDVLIPVLEQNSDRREIPDALRYWREGRRGKLFNSGKDTISSAKYVYFDIRDMEGADEEMSAIIYTIFNKIYSDITKPEFLNRPKFLFLDEAHRYLKNSEFSFWIDLLIRMGRHFNLLVGIITQSINDLVTEEDWSRGITNNIKQGIFFSGQKNIEESFLKLQMNMNHIDLYNEMKSSKREFLYWSTKGIRRVLTPLTDSHTYWMATTDPNERMLRGIIKNEIFNSDTGKSIEACVKATEKCEDAVDKRVECLKNYITENKRAS
ncbi:MAG: ATP-binding protein [Acidobacteriota bacterium]